MRAPALKNLLCRKSEKHSYKVSVSKFTWILRISRKRKLQTMSLRRKTVCFSLHSNTRSDLVPNWAFPWKRGCTRTRSFFSVSTRELSVNSNKDFCFLAVTNHWKQCVGITCGYLLFSFVSPSHITLRFLPLSSVNTHRLSSSLNLFIESLQIKFQLQLFVWEEKAWRSKM